MRRTSRMAGRDDDGGWEGIEAQGERKDFLWAASLRLEAFGRSAQSIERARESEELVDGSKKEAYGEKSRRETRGSMLVFFFSSRTFPLRVKSILFMILDWKEGRI